jgi:RimJ/RimL family protein N-acetyltransferase
MDLQELRAILRCAKGFAPSHQAAEIPIINDQRERIGYLKAIDRRSANDDAVVAMLTRWRQQSMALFLTQFTATAPRTKHWLTEIVLPDDARILFLVFDDAAVAKGTLGVCSIGQHQAEIDNVSRGESGGKPRLMYFALATLIDWLYRNLAVPMITLRVLSYNAKAIALYDSIGFQRVDANRLVKRQTADTLIYEVPGSHNEDVEPVDFQLVTMAIDRDHFYAKHPWMSSGD